MYYLYSLIFSRNVPLKLNINSFIATVINVWKFLQLYLKLYVNIYSKK